MLDDTELVIVDGETHIQKKSKQKLINDVKRQIVRISRELEQLSNDIAFYFPDTDMHDG